MADKRAKSPDEALDQVINWLELDGPVAPEVLKSLSERFLVAVCSPASTYIIVASKTKVVQIFNGKAICIPVPEGANINEEIEAKFGGRFLDVTNVFAACVMGVDGKRREKLQAHAEAGYAAAAPEHRMIMGA